MKVSSIDFGMNFLPAYLYDRLQSYTAGLVRVDLVGTSK